MKNGRTKLDLTLVLSTITIALLAAGIAGFIWFGTTIGIAFVAAAAVVAIIAGLQGRNQVLRNMDEQTRQSSYKFDTKKFVVWSVFAACAVFAVAILLAPVSNWFALIPGAIAAFDVLYIAHSRGKNFVLIAAMMLVMMLGTSFFTFAIEKTEGGANINVDELGGIVKEEDGKIIMEVDDVIVKEDLNLEGNLNVKGDEIVEGNQTVNGNSTIKGNQAVQGNQTVNGNSTIKGNQTVQGNQTVNGNSTIKGDQTVEGDVNVKGDLNVEGDANIKGDLNVEGDANINGDVNVGGNVNTTAPAPTAPQTTKPAPTAPQTTKPAPTEPTTKAPETTAPTEPTTKAPETTAPTEPAKNPQINVKRTIRYGETLYINLVDINASDVRISNKMFLTVQTISNNRIAITLNEDVTGYITITDSVSGINRVIDIVE